MPVRADWNWRESDINPCRGRLAGIGHVLREQ